MCFCPHLSLFNLLGIVYIGPIHFNSRIIWTVFMGLVRLLTINMGWVNPTCVIIWTRLA